MPVCPGFVEKDSSWLGQLDIPPNTVEELRAVPTFQRRNGGTDGGLREAQRLGCTSDVLPLRHGNEDPELLQSHPAHLIARGCIAITGPPFIVNIDWLDRNMLMD